MATPGQFIEQAMLSGFEQGQAQRQSKKADARQEKIKLRDQLATKISSLEEGTPEHKQAKDLLVQVDTDLMDPNHPMPIETIKNLLTGHFGHKQPAQPAPSVTTQVGGVSTPDISSWPSIPSAEHLLSVPALGQTASTPTPITIPEPPTEAPAAPTEAAQPPARNYASPDNTSGVVDPRQFRPSTPMLRRAFPAKPGFHLVTNPMEGQKAYYQSDSDPSDIREAKTGLKKKVSVEDASATTPASQKAVPGASSTPATPQSSYPTGKATPLSQTDKDSITQQFPAYAPYLDQVVIHPMEKGESPEDWSETYVPWESKNPAPGKLTMEPYAKTTPDEYRHMVTGEMLHYIGGVNPQTGQPINPEYQNLKQAVAAAAPPGLKKMDQDSYREAQRKGDKRSFEDWYNQSRLDETIMGYVNPDKQDNWRKAGVYNDPKMHQAVENLRQYLTGTRPNAAPAGAQGQPAAPAATTDTGQLPALPTPAVSIPGHDLTVKGPAQPKLSPRQQKAQSQAEQQAQLEIAAAPLSPEQQANVQAAVSLATINNSFKILDKVRPDLTEQERTGMRNEIIQHALGITEKPSLKLYTLPDGTKAWLDATHPELIPPGSTAAVTETEGTRKRADYQKFLGTHPDYEAKGGTFESFTAEQSGLGRNAALAAKPANRDDRWIAINQKLLQHQPVSEDDLAYKGAYDLWVQETKVAPGVARMAALSDDRYTWVYDLNDPDKNLRPMRMKDAVHAPVGSPQNIAFKTDAAITKYMIAGQGGVNINYFNTSTDHLKVLRQAADALNNGDYPAFNSFANRFATATGDPAPTNFDSVKSAVAGELSKTFKGTGATDQEIAEINTTINNAQSPAQIQGAIDYYTRLMGGKLNALKGQYESGKQGRPNLPGGTPPPATGGRYKHTATGPNNHKIGTNDDPNSPAAKWFDIVTGKPVNP